MKSAQCLVSALRRVCPRVTLLVSLALTTGASLRADWMIDNTANSNYYDQTGYHQGYFFSYWKSGGNARMTLQKPGQYDAVYNLTGNENLVCGTGWNPGSQTRVVNYNAGIWKVTAGNSVLALYGWTKNYLIEYYVVDSWGNSRPPGGNASGTVVADGATYDLYRKLRSNSPSIQGTQTFWQNWSVRRTKRPMGVNNTITFEKHKNAWWALNWDLGSTADYQIMATEGYGSRGQTNLTVW